MPTVQQTRIRVVLPAHLQALARSRDEVVVAVDEPPTIATLLDALEATYPVLQGTIRDHCTGRRRDFVRFFACEEDLSHEAHETPLPRAVAMGVEPFLIGGAIAGG